MEAITVDGYSIRVTNPTKLLWPELNIRKIDYLTKLMEIAPYILPHTKDRLLTSIRYPDGVNGKNFYQKNIPNYAPSWIERKNWRGVNYILLNSRATLAWLANQAAIELHTSFNLYQSENCPSSLVFDLDPSQGQEFEQVIEVAMMIYQTLLSLNISSYVKTSGATGLQIYIPIGEQYDYDTARELNLFFAEYFSRKHPKTITIERSVSKRGQKLYFDYLQMWHGKTITSVYSPRATATATVSTPISWQELEKGLKPTDFHLLNIGERLKKNGDLFAPLLDDKKTAENLDPIISFIRKGKH